MKRIDFVKFLSDNFRDKYHIAYLFYPQSQCPEPPFMVYAVDETDFEFADNGNYAKVEYYRVEFYFDHKDFDAEKEIEDALATITPFTKNEYYVKDEDMLAVIYNLGVEITDGEDI